VNRKTGIVLGLIGLTLGALTQPGAALARDRDAVSRPRLVVVISIDQCRADYMTRFADLYLPPKTSEGVGGFRYLMERGGWYADCRYDHLRTVTAAGHAILGTGAQPYLNGIVGNNWYDRATRKGVYCVDDPNSQVVGAQSGSRETPMSPANLLVTTVDDELELATGGASRTVSISLKDRAAILLAGHRADTVVWFDEGTGGWVSSSHYFPNGKLPEWVEKVNGEKDPDRLRAQPWKPGVSAEALRRVWKPKNGDATFTHALTGRDYTPFATSPAGNAFIFDTARTAVEAEQLGQDAIPDVLTLNLASNDYVGHRYGPDSAELLDITVATDREISGFLNFLDKKVPGGLKSVTFAVSADHGVVNVPELNTASGVPAGRSITSAAKAAADAALDAEVGPADWIASTDNGDFYFSEKALAAYPKEPRERLERIAGDAAVKVKGVSMAFGRTAVFAGLVPHSDLGRRITHGVHPKRSGDVMLILEPQWLPGSAPTGSGTSHGSPYPYDNHVPLLVAGFGIRPDTYTQPTQPAQLAPTLALLLGIARPSGAEQPLLPGVER
jgi:predicted AlkP superfamily pyrophosphatase or phosphodiesterase